MVYVTGLFMIGFVAGLVAVASNPSPYYGAFGLVVAGGMGCGILVSHGAAFLALILFLVYLGGMLVVFAYAAALAAEPYPEGLLSGEVAIYVGVYVLVLFLGASMFLGNWSESEAGEFEGFLVWGGDMSGVSAVYAEGWAILMLGAWVLLMTLFVVLEVIRGHARGALRAV
uniref:NADH-ubiquinone oxidoreductase chain 6 n=1 Tax=Indostomus paradoxus TaxID=181450 RepID=Q8HL94_INDPA|nr:NADH dehydrogenase subunit 6 [Indostomus paradoxus]BAC23604.1 NADH dehydrogenase subunit 6 [Indostomus paradoxus]